MEDTGQPWSSETTQPAIGAGDHQGNSRPASPIDIPTDDPVAALAFCQRLAKALSDPSIEIHGDSGQPLDRMLSGLDHSSADKPDLSVVIPIYEEEDNLGELHRRLTAVMQGTEHSYEIIFVDDGSRDNSPQLLRGLATNDSHVVVLELARNFGHQIAISAGLDFSQGDGVIVMDGDLQDPPEVLPEFIAKWREGYDVVYGVRAERKESRPMRAAYAGFYRLLRRTANVDIPLDAGDFCIMDQRVVNILRSMPERNRFVRGIRSWVGLQQTGLPYERQARHAGRGKYSLGSLTLLALDGFISFSHLPLRIASLLGFLISSISFLLAALYFIKRLVSGLNPPGFATLVVAIFFLAGIQLITIGVIGEYVGRIYDEVKRRPLYLVRQVSGHTINPARLAANQQMLR